jgi:hypothetical protein
MKVEKVSANIRYSQDTGKGAWKNIELGAKGSVDAEEQRGRLSKHCCTPNRGSN